MSTGVASPPSHPPLPKKPSLAPKPKVLAVTSQHNTLIEGESIESICSSSSSDAITNDSSHVTQEIQVQASTPETSKSTGNPSRPTPKPRKTINLNANGTPSEVAPSPRPRVLPKRNAPQRESEQSTPAEESSVSSSSTFLNGNEKDVTNSSPPNTQERPNTPVRRLTLGSSDFTPKVSPRNPKWSPVRGPLQRSNSSTSDYSASSSTILDVDVDTKSDNLTPDTKANGQNISLTDTLIKTENKDEDASSSVPTHRPKPNVSPKKPSLALLSKRKTMSSIGHISLDKDNEKLLSENGKKAVPQRPSLPPKRLSAIPIQNGSSSQLTGKSKSHAQELPKEDPPQSNGNKTQELSEDVSSSSESTNNNSPATKESAEQNSTVKSTKCESTSATISGTNISKPAEDSKAPPILPRKAILRNPVAPPRRVKSMSESDPNSELSTDMKRNGGFNNERSCQQKSLESQTKLQSEGEEKTEDNSNTERSTLKRNRRAVKSCDPLAFENVKPFKDKPNVPNGEVQQKSKPPRPPPPSKPSGLIHQTSLQGPPPRPKPIRAKTIDVTSHVNENFKSTSNKTHNQNSPLRSKKIHQVTYEKFDCSDWEIVDITPQQKQKIDEKGREKIISSEFFEDVAAQKSKSDAEIEPELKQSSSKKSNDEQLQQPKQLSKGEETILTKVSETENQPEGEAVSQLKLRKARPPVPAQRNSIEGSPVHKPSSTSVLEEKDVSFNDGNSQEINGRPLSQGSPINGRSPNSSPKKMLKDRGRGSSPRRPSCPPPPPPGVPQPNVATPRAQSPSPKITPAQPKSPTPSELSPAIKPKRPAPPRPNAPPVKMSPNSRSNSPKPALPQNNDAEEDQTNIYSEANVNFQNRDDDDEDSETSSRDHDYELIPDPRRTLTRNSEPTSCSDGETRKDSSSRASGYIDDGLYLEPNQREDEELNDNEYVYPEFMPANNIPISPPTPPPNPELDPVFTQEHPPVVPKNRLSSGARRKAPQKPKRSPSVQSDASFDSHSYYDMTGGMEHIERTHRSPSDRSGGSLTDSSGNEDGSLSDDFDDDEGNYAGVADLHDSEDGFDEFELPEARKRLQSLGRKAQKAFMVAKEIKDSEKVFVDVLKLLNVDLRQVIDDSSAKNGGKPVIEKAALDQIIGHLPQLQKFNEDLLTDLETRIRNWSTNPKIANIFLTKGHFLKLYSQYIQAFERITAAFDEACSKNPIFTQVVKEFEMSERCRNLAIKHYMLKPVQRIPQYKLLLTDYIKHLDTDSEEFKETKDALAIVSMVASHANESMRQGDNFEKLLAIQHSLIGSQQIVKPGRRLVKEGELLKMSRRVNQPRKFFLLTDVLLHTTQLPTGQYKLNNDLSLAGMKVNRSSQEDSYELEIISVQRSFTLLAASKEDCEAWYNALTKTIDEYENKKSTFDQNKPEHKGLTEGDTSSLGRKAPLWIPDSRVTMCMICTSEFTITWRRHHCRACGKVTCGHCSKNKAPLMYLSDKEARVCDKCYETLVLSQQKDGQERKERTKNKTNKAKRKKSNRQPVRSTVLQVGARDESNSSMSGYLWLRVKKKDWKRMWYRIKDKVLYTYKASEDVVAQSTTPLLGYAVCVINEAFEGFEPGLILQLTQGRMKHILRSETPEACARWNEAMVEASCLD